MNQLCVIFLIAAFTNEAFAQNPQSTSMTPFTTTAADGRITTTTLSPEIIKCIRECAVTSEYNPVCGTNNVTYDNPGRLICAQWCGVNVQFKRSGRCPPPPPEAEGVL